MLNRDFTRAAGAAAGATTDLRAGRATSARSADASRPALTRLPNGAAGGVPRRMREAEDKEDANLQLTAAVHVAANGVGLAFASTGINARSMHYYKQVMGRKRAFLFPWWYPDASEGGAFWMQLKNQSRRPIELSVNTNVLRWRANDVKDVLANANRLCGGLLEWPELQTMVDVFKIHLSTGKNIDAAQKAFSAFKASVPQFVEQTQVRCARAALRRRNAVACWPECSLADRLKFPEVVGSRSHVEDAVLEVAVKRSEPPEGGWGPVMVALALLNKAPCGEAAALLHPEIAQRVETVDDLIVLQLCACALEHVPYPFPTELTDMVSPVVQLPLLVSQLMGLAIVQMDSKGRPVPNQWVRAFAGLTLWKAANVLWESPEWEDVSRHGQPAEVALDNAHWFQHFVDRVGNTLVEGMLDEEWDHAQELHNVVYPAADNVVWNPLGATAAVPPAAQHQAPVIPRVGIAPISLTKVYGRGRRPIARRRPPRLLPRRVIGG